MTEPTDAELGKLAEECGIGWGAGLGGMSDFLSAFARAVLAAAERDRGGEAVAWMHPDGRVIPASTMLGARKDGGAILSSLRGYTTPLYLPPPQPGGVSETDAADAARYRWIRAPLDDSAEFTPGHGSYLYATIDSPFDYYGSTPMDGAELDAAIDRQRSQS